MTDTFYLSEIFTGWEAISLESEQERDFIEQNLKTDQDQDYFVGGSIYDETLFDFFYPAWGFTYPFSFQAYSPRQTVNVFVCGMLSSMH